MPVTDNANCRSGSNSINFDLYKPAKDDELRRGDIFPILCEAVLWYSFLMAQPVHTLCELSAKELEALMKDWGQPAFRAKQIYQQVFVNLAESPNAMSNFPAALRGRLSREVPLGSLELTRVQTGDKGRPIRLSSNYRTAPRSKRY